MYVLVRIRIYKLESSEDKHTPATVHIQIHTHVPMRTHINSYTHTNIYM